MRPKRGVGAIERVNSIWQSKIFDRIRILPDAQERFAKVQVIEGDITKPLFGISSQDIDLLSEQVTIAIHSAATVRFDEPLKLAVENNVVSVENLVNLASKMNNLEALIHVSTAYSNCDRSEVDEVFYEAPIQADKLIEMSRWMDPEVLDRITPSLMDGRPNSYTYTKAVAESLLRRKSREVLPHLAIGMVRPSIVGGTWSQPIRGWVDNFNGPTGMILAMMSGSLQAMHVKKHYCADMVPVDMVANLIICAAWKVHQEYFKNQDKSLVDKSDEIDCKKPTNDIEKCDNITIFNCVSSSLNPLIWNSLHKYIYEVAKEYPINASMRPAGSLLLSSEFLFKLYSSVNHASIAYVGDFMLKMMGKKSKLVPLHQRLMKMTTILKPFTTKEWLFNCTNTTRLVENMTSVDREIFNFDIRKLEWRDYLPRYYIGSK